MKFTPKTHLRLPIEALAAAMLLAACGGGDTTSSPASETALALHDSPATTDDLPEASTLVAAPSVDASARESALAHECARPSFGTPRVAAWDMTRDTSAERQALLGRFSLSVVNLPANSERIAAFSAGVKAANPSAALAQYLSFPDLRVSPSATDYAAPLAAQVHANGWWLKDGSGNAVAASGARGHVNVTSWTRANADGQRYPQLKAAHDHASYFASGAGLDYVFSANTWARPRTDADWRGDGTNQRRSDASVQAALRSGYAAYWASLRALDPTLKIVGGLDNANDLSSAEYKGQLDGAFLDGMIGKPWSLESNAGWDAMMRHYRAALGNTRGDRSVVFAVYGSSPTDYATLRFGLASALLDNGSFMFIPASGSAVPAWYDEYSAQLGSAVDASPLAPAANGIYLRRFENGLVLVNPNKTASASIDVGPGYKRLSGTQDPAVNNGVEQSLVTLGPREGLLMLKVPAPCADPEPTTPTTPTTFATPRVAALDYSRDMSEARKDMLAKYKFVILNFTKTMGSAKLQSMAAALKQRNPGLPIAQYIISNEVRCYPMPYEDSYAVSSEVSRNNWWLRTAAGARVQWTKAYRNCDINFGAASPKNDKGQTFNQFKWQHDHNAWFKNAPAVDYVFIDNFVHETRDDADWKRIGVDLPKGNGEAARMFREGMVDFVATIRASAPSLKVLGNINHDLSLPEYHDVLDGAFIEGLIGKSWSQETWAGWDSMMRMYRGALKRTRIANTVFLNTFADPTDYRTIRYGLASALLEDGYHLHVPGTGTAKPNWLDDYGAPIGDAIEPPPTVATQNGIWLRRYANGLVLVNPHRTASASINVGPGYKRLSGKQDPTVNNGKAESTVTLGPREGLLMIKQ